MPAFSQCPIDNQNHTSIKPKSLILASTSEGQPDRNMTIGALSLLLTVIFLFGSKITVVTAKPQVPCYFVFGDSLSDSGNNNHIHATTTKANFKPYGIDFPGSQPTGRFTNDRTFVDVITELLGFDNFIPPFNEKMGSRAKQGVNYASGGAGILYETGRRNLGEVISFDQQIQNHRKIVVKISKQVNLSRCLYTVNIGSNDYINNYFNPKFYPTRQIFDSKTFASYLIRYYRSYIKDLYKLGARKVAFYMLGNIGCVLGEIAAFSNGGKCVESINHATAVFNNKLVSAVRNLRRQLPGARFTLINTTAVPISAFKGITVFNSSCCAAIDGQCLPFTKPCLNRNQYYFWDMFHPTDAVTRVLGYRAYKAQSTKEAYPYDISHIAKM